jgi:phenylalanyl-tRNA synthetase alpha chain
VREELHNLRNEALALIQEAKDRKELEAYRIAFLGRKGKVNQLLKKLAGLDKEKKAQLGQLINEFKTTLDQAIKNREKSVGQKVSRVDKFFDVTLPGKKPSQGHLHLVTQAIEEIQRIFADIGFIRVRYPEVDWDWYAFETLNMPPDHPARDDFESFYIDAPLSNTLGRLCLTPHTSNGQVREMQRTKPPIRMINIGKCYRPNYDPSHTPMFHQFEGLVIDKNIAIPQLEGTLDYFAKQYFGLRRQTRLRPFHFQFTEPSFEVDITCGICDGKGCRFCKKGWLELGGAGMVHPNVLRAGGINPKKYTGFAFGWGVERVLMMHSGLKIPDMRILFKNDLRFLEQF